MKRSYAEIERDLVAAQARVRVLEEEQREHPQFEKLADDARFRRTQAREQFLAYALPPFVHRYLCATNILASFRVTAVEVNTEMVIDGDTGFRQWNLMCSLADGDDAFFSLDVSEQPPRDIGPDSFDLIDFDPDVRRMWRAAMMDNAQDVACALAAFWFACQQELHSWDAVPSQAFPVPKNKDEVA